MLGIKSRPRKYEPISKFPAAKRDLALLVKEDVSYKEIIDFVETLKIPFEYEINLFDIYRGKQIESGYKSLAISLTFRSKERTLTDVEVDEIFHLIINELREKKNIHLRD